MKYNYLLLVFLKKSKTESYYADDINKSMNMLNLENLQNMKFMN